MLLHLLTLPAPPVRLQSVDTQPPPALARTASYATGRLSLCPIQIGGHLSLCLSMSPPAPHTHPAVNLRLARPNPTAPPPSPPSAPPPAPPSARGLLQPSRPQTRGRKPQACLWPVDRSTGGTSRLGYAGDVARPERRQGKTPSKAVHGQGERGRGRRTALASGRGGERRRWSVSPAGDGAEEVAAVAAGAQVQ